MECSGGDTKSSNRVVLSLNPSGYEKPRVMSTGRGLRGWTDRRCEREGYVRERDSSRFSTFTGTVCTLRFASHANFGTPMMTRMNDVVQKGGKRNLAYYTQLVRSRKKRTVRPSPCIFSKRAHRYRSSNVLSNVDRTLMENFASCIYIYKKNYAFCKNSIFSH